LLGKNIYRRKRVISDNLILKIIIPELMKNSYCEMKLSCEAVVDNNRRKIIYNF